MIVLKRIFTAPQNEVDKYQFSQKLASIKETRRRKANRLDQNPLTQLLPLCLFIV